MKNVRRFIVNVPLLAGMIASLMVLQAVPASAANEPAGYCSHGWRPGCVVSTWQLPTLIDDSASYYLYKGGSLTINICKTWSNTGSLGGQFGPIKKFVSLNFGIQLATSYQICTGASTPVPSTGYWHWHGYAKRWESKVYQGLLCGKGYCIQNFSYPTAQDRWYFKPTKG